MPSHSQQAPPGAGAGRGGGRRHRAPEVTHREALWYARRIEQATPLVVRLRDGEELRGVLEWYDRSAYRLKLDDGGHLVVQKSAVQTLRKA